MFYLIFRFLFASYLSLVMGVSTLASTPTVESGRVAIFSPLPGQAVQGKVPILGSMTVDGFSAYELAFAYQNDLTDTWFLIQEGDTPIVEREIAQWDTSTIADGDYSLRLTVVLIDGRRLVALVPVVRVRNYTPIETDTPAPSPTLEMASALEFTPTSSPTLPSATLTPLPTNPASLSFNQIAIGWGRGALFGIGVLVLWLMLLGIRQGFKRP